MSDRMAEQLGYESSEVMGKLRFEDLLSKGSRIFYKTHFHPILMAEKKVDEIVLSFHDKSDENLPVLLNLSLDESEKKPLVKVVGIPFEKRNKFEKGILEAKKAAEQALLENALLTETKEKLKKSQLMLEHQLQYLERMNHELQEFNKILAHDLQEPLRKIQTFSSRLKHLIQNSDTDHTLDYLDRISRISERNHEIIRRLQSYYSLDYRPLTYNMSGLKDMILAARENIEIPFPEPEFNELKAVEIYGDVPKLTLLWEELLLNSLQNQSTERPLQITISSKVVQENYYQALQGAYRYMGFSRISYRDNGIGFPEGSENRIFKPLQKFSNTHGSGLGLAFCKKIVELHNGRISMNRLKEGGTEFIIMLPSEDINS